MRSLALAALLAPTAAAAVEGETTLSATAHFSSLTVTDEDGGGDVSGLGGGLAIDVQRALSDTFWLRGAVGGALHEGPLWSGTAAAGLTYAIDVLKYVPYVGAAAGVALVGGDALGDTKVKPFIELGVGLDVLQGRSWSWGVDARFSSFASGLALFEIGPRFSLRWGYF